MPPAQILVRTGPGASPRLQRDREHRSSRQWPLWADCGRSWERRGRVSTRFPHDPAVPAPPVEKQIYSGFYSHADKALLAEFQRADWPRRQEIVATLADPRLRQLGRRLVALHAPELLSIEERAQFQAWLQERWTAPDIPGTEWISRDRARAALDAMREDAGIDPGLVNEVGAYLLRDRSVK